MEHIDIPEAERHPPKAHTHPIADIVSLASELAGLAADIATKAALVHTHAAADIASGLIAQARLGTGSAGAGAKFLADDQTYKALAGTKMNTSSPSGNVNVVNGSTETIINGCDITLAPVPSQVFLTWNIWHSQYWPGQGKSATLRLRRTDVSGTILTSIVIPEGAVDSVDGHVRQWFATWTDPSPTDGQYVLTIQGNGAGIAIWSDERHFLVIGT